MDEDAQRNDLLQVLKERCPRVKFRDDDINNLVAAGYTTADALEAATEEDLVDVLPGRRALVRLLLKAFVQPAGKAPLNKSKSSLEASEALRQVLGEKYPDSGVEDDDFIKLVAAGFSTAPALAAATKEDLDSVFPGRPGVVRVLLKAFVQPAGKAPLNKSKSSLEASEALRQVLGEKYPDSGVEDDDFIKLVAAGFSTAPALAAATKEDLDSVFPGRPGVVRVLLKAFVQPAGKAPLNKSKSSLEASEALRQVLGEKYPDSGVEDDDFIKLVAAGFSTAAALAAATMERLDAALPGRPGVVRVLLKAFVQPAGEGSPLKRGRVETPRHWQDFVQSAAKHYKEWEDSADVEKDSAMKFLTVSGDPLLNFPDGYLLGIRECYRDLKKILEDSEAGRRFVLLGTAGIGKSCFSVFWVCHLAANKKKVVWKLYNKFNLLDFSDGAAKFDGQLDEWDPKIQEVFRDDDAWLILDGGQTGGFDCACHVLVPCSDQKQNYAEFCKGQRVSTLYLPVWEEKEISQYLDAFEKHRLDFKQMRVPSKKEAIGNYALLGGVARYVLCSANTAARLTVSREALRKLDAKYCLKMLKNDFDALPGTRDVLVHMTCGSSTDDPHGKYSTRDLKFATSGVKSEVIAALDKEFKADTVKILKELMSCTGAGSYVGYIFELVGHYIFIGGGEFRRKRVLRGGGAEELGRLKLPKLTCHRFESLETLPKLEADTYYYPKAGNLASIDAILYPNRLLQFFNYSRGDHGYLVTGLEKVHAQLKQDKYELWSCVPKEKYEGTGFQSWLTSTGLKYKQELQLLEKFEQYVIEVDHVKFGP